MSEENKEGEQAPLEEATTPPAKPGAKPKSEGPKEKGVSKKEFSDFQGEVMGAINSLAAAIQGIVSQPAVTIDSGGISAAPVVKDEAGPQAQTLVPPAWRNLADEILGPDFEIDLELPENGGQKFTIYVPIAKSNADKDYLKTYKKDKRTKELGNTGIRGVREWLLRVRRNLTASGIRLPYFVDNQPKFVSTR